MNVTSYRDLQVRQEAVALVEQTYALSATFPADERFGLTAQLRRASVSVASNIAEGHARPGTGDYLRFLGISLGSLAKVETQLEVARRLDYGDEASIERLLTDCDKTGKMLRGLWKSLTARRNAPPAPSP